MPPKKKKEPETLPLVIRPLTPTDWSIVEQLFGPRGACGGCWCMAWRVSKHKEWVSAKGDVNRDRLRALVESGALNAVLAFAGTEPVGWCSFGPRATFPRLQAARSLQTEWQEDTWSIVCFYIPSAWRGRQIGTRLLEAATTHAFALGAKAIEGYPAVPWDEQVPMPAAFAWTGVPRLFKVAGYRKMSRPGQKRPVYVKTRIV